MESVFVLGLLAKLGVRQGSVASRAFFCGDFHLVTYTDFLLVSENKLTGSENQIWLMEMKNRELKFRVWCPLLKRFALDTEDGYVYQEDDFRNGTFIVGCDNGQVIQQSTGLNDKNGRVIYEGDIVKTSPDYISILFSAAAEYSAGEVRWWNEGFALCQKNVGATRISEYSHCNCCPCGLEIIGNIFENPELCAN